MLNSNCTAIDNIIICTENAYKYVKPFAQIRQLAKTSANIRSQLIQKGIIKGIIKVI